MKEFNPFRSDRAPLTNWVGHQVTKAVCAGSASLEKVKDSKTNWKHTYDLKLMEEQKYDFMRGNAFSALALMVAALASNSVR
jgi:hypothetical protein